MRSSAILSVAALFLLSAIAVSTAEEDTSGYEGLGRPMLGVVMTPPTGRDIKKNNLDPHTGVVIRRVYPNSTASEMGLKPGDVITEINGVPIESMSKMREVVQSYYPGDDVNLVVRRDGEDAGKDGFLGGWPETIPFREIDGRAEDRFRNMQEMRLARQAERLQQLRGEEERMARSVEQLRAERDKAQQAAEEFAQAPEPVQAAAKALETAQKAPQGIWAVPAWRFSWDMNSGEAQQATATATADRVAAAANNERAPGSIRYGFTVHSDTF